MLLQFHESITRKALTGLFSLHALDVIVAANLGQDNLLTGQLGHDEFHYDNNAFTKSDRYLEDQRRLTISALQNNDPGIAWTAFGRLTHTAQDFYAHSNYVDMWLARFTHKEVVASNFPMPAEIDALVKELLNSPDLHSGKLYYPLEALYFVPFLKHFILPLLPKDSHAHMNLDSPKQGKRFAFAFEAAVKRTILEFNNTVLNLPANQKMLFRGT